MDLICPECVVTWYPGEPPSTDAPFVILASGDLVEGPNPFTIGARQRVQGGEYLRSNDANFWPRGGKSDRLRFTRVTRIVAGEGETKGVAGLEDALTRAASLPDAEGWLKIEPADSATVWQMSPATIEDLESWTDPVKGLRFERLEIRAGQIGVHTGDDSGIWTSGELIAGPTSTDRGALLLGPNRDLTPAE